MNRDGIGPPPSPRPLATVFGVLVAVLAVAAVIGLWWLASMLGVDKKLLPAPPDALRAYGEMWDGAQLLAATRATALNAVIGFGIGTLLGGLFGLLFGANHGFRRLMDGAGSVLLALPVLFAAPLLTLAFGIGSGTVFVTAAALASTLVVSVLFGAALGTERQGSRLFLALQFGALAALAATLVAEMIGSKEGLGFLFVEANNQLRADLAFAIVLHAWLLGLVFSLPFALIRWMVK